MIRIGLIVVALVISTPLIAAPPAFNYLECSFDKTRMVIGFVEQPPQIIDALEPNIPMSDQKVTDHQISAISTNVFHSHNIYSLWYPDAKVEDASSMRIKISRLSGDIELAFMKQYGAAERNKCLADEAKAGPWVCYSIPVSAIKYGTCRKVVRRF
jgi:hypothetical protein